MNARDAIKVIRSAYPIRRPVLLLGSPGVGKSDLCRASAAELGIECRALHLPQIDPVDLRGIPCVRDGVTTWAPSADLPREGAGILLLDEVSAAPSLVQVACYQLTLDRRLGEYHLPDDWLCVLAGNLATDRAASGKISTALCSRALQLTIEPELETWVAWAMAAGIRSEVIGFLRFRPALLTTFDPRSPESSYACPRTWAMLSDFLGAGIPAESELEVYSGIVGSGPATEFIGFLRLYRTLPPLDSLIADPTGSVVPSDPATLYAVASGLATRATPATMGAICTYAGRMPAEYSVLCIGDAARKDTANTRTPAFISWATKHADFVL